MLAIYTENFTGLNDSKAILLIKVRNWFYSVLEFDPNTDESLSSDITSFLDKISCPASVKTKNNLCDWLFKSLSYCKSSLFYLLENPRNEIIRSHERMNIYQAKEIDSSGIMEISRRPGRTVREKIATNPTILAVRREQGADTLENRLLKKYLTRILPILEARQNCFLEKKLEDEDSELSHLYSKIRRWLKSEVAQKIGKWQNLPPNNILLHDKNYKKIWRTWQYLLDLDEIVNKDWNDLNRILAVFVFWKMLAILQKRGSKIKQAPLEFNYNEFNICTCAFKDEIRVDAENYFANLSENEIIVTQNEKTYRIKIAFNEVFIEIENRRISDSLITFEDAEKIANKLANSIEKNPEARKLPEGFPEEQKFVAINFSEFPYDSVAVSNSGKIEKRNFDIKLARQFWIKEKTSEWIDLDCSFSPAVYEEKINDYNLQKVSFEDIFFNDETQNRLGEKHAVTAYKFMSYIRSYYNTDTIYYLLPDYLEDFSLSAIRSATNTVFPSANPVPNSIGAVFDFHNSDDFEKYSICENDFVFVIEKSEDNKISSITPIQAKTTYETKEKVLNLKDYGIPFGIRWEHHPSVITNEYDPSKIMDYIQSAISKTEGIEKYNKVVIISAQKTIFQSIEKSRLKLPNDNYFFINTPFNSANGVEFYARLQDKVSDIPMWSEHLPILQMTYLKNGKRSGHSLTQGKTILPLRGKKQKIEISDKFILNKNVSEYHFRLSRGDANNSIKYEACLRNSAFPLKKDTECSLEMFYIYADENPFELHFIPTKSSEFARAKVEWKKIDESAFPTPNFPPVRTWNEFVNWKDDHKPKDLTEWESNNFEKIHGISDFFYGRENIFERYTRKIPTQKYKDSSYYIIQLSKNIFAKIYEKQLSNFKGQLNKARTISFSLKKKKSESYNGSHVYKATGVTSGISLDKNTITWFSRSFRFPAIQIWNTSRSVLEDDATPQNFKSEVQKTKNIINELLHDENVKQQPYLWNELLLQLCFMHKDATEISEKYLDLSSFEEIDFENWRVVEQKLFQAGYFIGNCETQKQKEFFYWLLEINTGKRELDSFKLQALCIALWRGENLLEKIPASKIKGILDLLFEKLNSEIENIEKQEQELTNRMLNPLRYYLELLCALIRARKFTSEYKKIFSPFDETMKNFIKKIEQIYSLLSQKGKKLIPRQIKFTIEDGDNETQFLDHLLSYLDGEKSSEMPRIESATSESDDENFGDESDKN